MAEKLIRKIDTASGPQRIDYNALANLPDLSSVGVQADWNVNDEASKSHIFNRTHYVADDGTIVRLDSKFMPLGVVTGITTSKITGGHRITMTTNNGTKTIDVMDGSIGDDGKPGKDGNDGKDGVTPHIGANGNWYLGTTDTEVSASGLQANADFEQEDETAVDYIKNKPRIGKDYIILTDTVNGYDYSIRLMNGNLVSSAMLVRIEITTPPTKTEYMKGQKFDPSGMVVSGITQDGNRVELSYFKYPTEAFMTVSDNFEVEISYEEFGRIYKSDPLIIKVNEFDPTIELVDFNYSSNSDGTYTLTSWKGTTGNVTGTELIIPDNTLVML